MSTLTNGITMFGKAVAHALCKGCEQIKFCLVGDFKEKIKNL